MTTKHTPGPWAVEPVTNEDEAVWDAIVANELDVIEDENEETV